MQAFNTAIPLIIMHQSSVTLVVHCKFQSVRATQNSHNGHTKFEFSMTIMVILYDIHTLEFAVYLNVMKNGYLLHWLQS